MTDTTLNDEQIARAEALRKAKEVLRVGSPLGPGVPIDAVDLHSLAVFILDGGDLWSLDEVREAGTDEVREAGTDEGRVPSLSFESKTAPGSPLMAHGFLAHTDFDVFVNRTEGAEATCTVMHDGKVIFSGSESAPEPLLTFAQVRQVDLATEADVVDLKARLANAEAENERLRRTLKDVREMHTNSRRDVEFENERGGEARKALLDIAAVVGFDLAAHKPWGGDIWHPRNLARITKRVERRQRSHERLADITALALGRPVNPRGEM